MLEFSGMRAAVVDWPCLSRSGKEFLGIKRSQSLSPSSVRAEGRLARSKEAFARQVLLSQRFDNAGGDGRRSGRQRLAAFLFRALVTLPTDPGAHNRRSQFIVRRVFIVETYPVARNERRSTNPFVSLLPSYEYECCGSPRCALCHRPISRPRRGLVARI